MTISPPKLKRDVLNAFIVQLVAVEPVSVTMPSTSRRLLPEKLQINGLAEVEWAVKLPLTVSED